MLTKQPGSERKTSHMLFVFLTVLLVYLWSAPRTVVFEDDGIFILSSYFNGISHPPGYPLYTLLGHLATLLPIGSVAFRVHALTGCLGAAACAVLYAITLMLFNNRVFAIAAALCLGISRTFWSQAIIAEVYTLNVLIYLILLWGAVFFVKKRESTSNSFLASMFFVYGLGLSNHWPLLILSTPSILAVLWPRLREILRYLPKGICFLMLGLTPYVWMVARSHMDPVISFYGPLDSLKEIWFVISRQGYAEVDHSITAGYIDKLRFCLFVGKETAIQAGPLAGILALIGFIRQWQCWKVNISIGLVLAYLGNTILLVFLLGFDFTPFNRDIFKVYPLIGYSVLAIWIALGMRETAEFIKNRVPTGASLNVVNVVICFVTVITGLLTNIPYNYRARDKLAENYALTILETLDRNAIYFTGGDLDTGTLGYLNLIEKVRPDVTLYNVRSLVFDTRLENPMHLNFDTSIDILSEFIESTNRPIYYLDSLPLLYGVRDYGLYRRIDKSMHKGQFQVVESSRIMAFYRGLLSVDNLFDAWENMVSRTFISDYCRIATHFHFYNNPEQHEAQLLRTCQGYYGLISAASVLLTDPRPQLDFIASLLDKAEQLRQQAKDRQDYATYLDLRGTLLQAKGDIPQAIRFFKRGIREWPDDRNPSYGHLQTLLKSSGKYPAEQVDE